MRLISLDRCKEGLELAKTIYDSNGQALLTEGYKLTDRVMQRLRVHNVFAVYIKDKYSDGIIEDNGIPHELKQKALTEIKGAFTSFKSDKILKGRINQKTLSTFQNLCDEVLQELQYNKKALSLMTSVQVYDNYLFNHSFNVMVYSLQLAVNSGVQKKDLDILGMGGLLHDVGKMVIPLEILNKKERLTKEEFDLIKTHTTEGYEYLRRQHEIPILVSHCAYQHHEKIDGTGYPRGLKGDNIYSLAKIMAVADVFDAVTSSRSYRAAMLPHKGLEILYGGAGTHFDTQLVQNFRKSVIMYPVGVTVKLNTGEVGFILKNNDSFPERPVIRVLEKEGVTLQDSEVHDIDMLTNLTAEIVHCDTIM